MTTATVITQENLEKAKQAIKLANPDIEPGADEKAALKIIDSLDRDQVVELATMAVAQRNTDEIDYLPDSEQRKLVFAEGFMLSLLSEVERDQVLGPNL